MSSELQPVTRPRVSGMDLRLLADRAWSAGQKALSTKLHELARGQETEEDGR